MPTGLDAPSGYLRVGVRDARAGHPHDAAGLAVCRSMEIGEPHAFVREAVHIRCRYLTAERAEIGETEIVDDDEEDIRLRRSGRTVRMHCPVATGASGAQAVSAASAQVPTTVLDNLNPPAPCSLLG